MESGRSVHGHAHGAHGDSPAWGYQSGMSITNINMPGLPLERLGIFGNLEVYAVLGYRYPTGSIKYRAARAMIDAAEQRGKLRRPMGIVERSSGNTGIALAYEGPRRGYHVRIYTGEGVTNSAKRMMNDDSIGTRADVIEAPGFFSSHRKLIESLLEEEHGRWFWPDQHSSTASLRSNAELGYTIARHIKPDIFIASAGTGSTISGVGGGLKEKNDGLLVYLTVPEEEFLSPGVDDPGTYDAPLFDTSLIDGRLPVNEREAIEAAQALHSYYEHPVGVSSGAVFAATRTLGEKKRGRAVVIFPDHRNRYPHLL